MAVKGLSIWSDVFLDFSYTFAAAVMKNKRIYIVTKVFFVKRISHKGVQKIIFSFVAKIIWKL